MKYLVASTTDSKVYGIVDDVGFAGLDLEGKSYIMFDEVRNQELVTFLTMGNWNQFTITNGKLYGTDGLEIDLGPVTIINKPVPPIETELLADLDSGIAWLGTSITSWGTMTANQKQTWLANNFLRVLQILRRMLKILRWIVLRELRR